MEKNDGLIRVNTRRWSFSGPLDAHVEFTVKDVFLHDLLILYHNLGPEACPRVDDHVVPDYRPWTNHRIVLEAAFVADERIVIDDAPAHRRMFPDDDPVVDGTGEDLCILLDQAILSYARIGPDQHVVANGRSGTYRDGPDEA